MRSRAFSYSGLALALALFGSAVTGCTPADEPDHPATPPASASAPATSNGAANGSSTGDEDASTNDSSEPARLVVSASGVEILSDSQAVVGGFDYFEPVGPVVDELTSVFGAEPVVTTYDGTGAAGYDWPGFSLGTDGPAILPTQAETFATITAPELNGIALETLGGTVVGDDLVALAQEHPANAYTWSRQGVEELVVQIDEVTADDASPDKKFSVTLRATPATGPLTEISAPAKNFE